MSICPSSDQVYNDVLRKCIPKSSQAGRILSNPENKRCKGQKVVNPVSNRCVEKTNPTVRRILMMEDDAKENTEHTNIIKRGGAELHKARYIPENSKKYDTRSRLLKNAILAVYRIYRLWSTGKLKTNAQIQALQKEFNILNQYVLSIPSMPHDAFYKEIVNIQRLEEEHVSHLNFEMVFNTLFDRLASPMTQTRTSVPPRAATQPKAPSYPSSVAFSSASRSSPQAQSSVSSKSSAVSSSATRPSPKAQPSVSSNSSLVSSSETTPATALPPPQPLVHVSKSSSTKSISDDLKKGFFEFIQSLDNLYHDKNSDSLEFRKPFTCNAWKSLWVIYKIYKKWSSKQVRDLASEFDQLDSLIGGLRKESFSRKFMHAMTNIKALQDKQSSVTRLQDFEMVMSTLYKRFIENEAHACVNWANVAEESLSPLPSKLMDASRLSSPKRIEDEYAWNEKNNELFHASETHMYNLIPNFQNGSHIEKHYVQHLENVIQSKYTPLPFGRTLDEINIDADMAYKAQSSSKKINDLSLFNCHDGQRKLTLGYLEFIAKSISDLKCTAKDVFIIYAGSSGLASAIAATIFPELMMAIYDPDPNTVKYLPKGNYIKPAIYRNTAFLPVNGLHLSPLMVFTNKAGWFNDAVATYGKNVLFPLSRRKHLLFVSDVRADTKEIDIIQDMKAQMRWTMLLNCDYYMHKFRLPYYDSIDEIKMYKNMYENIDHLRPFLKSKQPLIKNFHQRRHPSSLLYIDGDMYIQPFGPQRTTEFRLIGKPNREKKYAFRYYNVSRIENQAALFNNVYRGYASYYYQNKDVKDMQPYVSSYEKITEFHILLSCLNTRQSIIKRDPFSMHKMQIMFNLFNNIMFEIVKIKPNITECKYVSLQKSLRKRKENYQDVVPAYFDNFLKRKA